MKGVVLRFINIQTMQKACEECGETEKRVILFKGKNLLCNRHRIQLMRKGKFYKTRFERNEIIESDEHISIILYDNESNAVAKTIISKQSYDLVKDYKWCLSGKGGYAIGSKPGNRKKIFLHNVLMPRKDGYFTDHINRNRLDNRLENLRYATPSQNNMNRSGIRGVSFDKANKKWTVSIEAHKKKVWLGRFVSYEDAVKVREKAEREYFGEYASNPKTLTKENA